MKDIEQVLENFKKLNVPTEEEVIKYWKDPKANPVVSIACITYNHESYIEDTIKGFLIQKTDFSFEVIIHDDASTDGTREILKGYASRYPSIIKLILQEENQYSQGIKPGAHVYPLCKGRYVSLCEGDDFWCDETKLQKQVDYLDANPDVYISSFDAFNIDKNGKIIKESKLPDLHKRDYTGLEMMQGKAWLLTMNWMRRNNPLPKIPERNSVKNGDIFMTSVYGQYGGSHHHTDIKPSAYRVHTGGVWSSLSQKEKDESHINTYFWMYKYWTRMGKPEIARIYWIKFLRMVVSTAAVVDTIKCFLIVKLRLGGLKAALQRLL